MASHPKNSYENLLCSELEPCFETVFGAQRNFQLRLFQKPDLNSSQTRSDSAVKNLFSNMEGLVSLYCKIN
jgi:hypothetical protein